MFAVDTSWGENPGDGQDIDEWARANCPSYVVPKFRLVRTSISSRLSFSIFEFTDEADAVIFALKWK